MNRGLFVLCVCVFGMVSDQALKHFLLGTYHLETLGSVPLTSFLNLTLVWNQGVSYGLFEQETPLGQLLLASLALILSCFLWGLAIKAKSSWMSFGYALVIGGALGNALDRLRFGAVVDFIHFHYHTFSWYIFNLADVWIVLGVFIILLNILCFSPQNIKNTL